MRLSATALLCLLFLLCPAAADDKDPAPPPKPLTEEQAADAVLAAVKAEDDAALKALAAKDKPDPWLVADLLCSRGKHEAAAAFSIAAPRPAVEGLARYVASRRGQPDDADARESMHNAVAKMQSGDAAGAYASLKDVVPDQNTNTGIRILYYVGLLAGSLGQPKEAIEAALLAAGGAEQWGWLAMALEIHDSAGLLHQMQGNTESAANAYQHALGHAEVLEDLPRAATLSERIGSVYLAASDNPNALRWFERARRILERVGGPSDTSRILSELGRTYLALGNFGQSLAHGHRALKLHRELNDLAAVAADEINIGVAHNSLADYPKALEFYEQGLRDAKTSGQARWASYALNNIGGVYWALGDLEKAREYAERSLKRVQATGDRLGLAPCLSGLGLVHKGRGEYKAALEYYKRALLHAKEQKQRSLTAKILVNIGSLNVERGEHLEAVRLYEEALEILKQIGARVDEAHTIGRLGWLRVRMGKRKEGLALLDRSIREARRLRARPLLAENLRQLARIHLDGGDADRALSTARGALREVEHLLGGLGEENAASVRARHAELFAIGTLAAARLDAPADAVTFLESGRAGALLELMGGRKALRWTDLSEGLRQAEMEVKRLETAARNAYRAAIDAGDRSDRRIKRKALDDATRNVRDVAARIQREAKGQAAGLFYPTAATMEEIRASLTDGQAMVLYGLCLDEALAIVLTQEGQTLRSLGSVQEVTTACEALTASDVDSDPASALAHLKKILVTPLSLPKVVTHLIVSPEGALSYAPFGAICDQTVSLTPSGTTHTLLRDEDLGGQGKGVLALGDPDYGGQSDGGLYVRGRKLARLPATRVEAKQIDQEALLGSEATEESFRARLAERGRWRAVHFACHGIVDPERPDLSSLALSRTNDEDGFLTALEILRMRIPADLAVLSACETSRGKIVRGEGIVGLTRAFMYAGAPRVICSLWKVDDEATQALMIKFYELWNPKDGSKGLGAAAALKQAQAFIKGHDKWKHPYYWAAWVLWGLPD